MPYIPFIPPAGPGGPGSPFPYVSSVLGGYTTGTITGRDYTLHLNAIALELNKIGFFLSPAAALDSGSLAASLSASSLNLGIITENIADIHLEIKALNLNVQKLANKMEVSTKGVANISSHMSKQTIIQTMAMNDQIKTNEFQKQVTNQAQEAAGLPKTVVTPAAFTEKAKEVIADVSTNNALITGAALVQQAAATAATEGFTIATQWVAESAVGVWVKDAYAETEILVVGLFSKEKAKQLADKLKVRQNTIKAGGVPT